MNPDALIPIATNFTVAFFFLLAPLLLARKWMPRSTRLAERLAIPVLGGVVLLALLVTAAPHLLVLLIPILSFGAWRCLQVLQPYFSNWSSTSFPCFRVSCGDHGCPLLNRAFRVIPAMHLTTLGQEVESGQRVIDSGDLGGLSHESHAG